MKEIIYLAEQFLKIAKLGHTDKDLREVGVIYHDFLGEDMESIAMGRVCRTFKINGSLLELPDGIYFDEKARNEFIEEYTLKLNQLRSVIEFNRQKTILAEIEQLQQHLTVAA